MTDFKIGSIYNKCVLSYCQSFTKRSDFRIQDASDYTTKSIYSGQNGSNSIIGGIFLVPGPAKMDPTPKSVII